MVDREGYINAPKTPQGPKNPIGDPRTEQRDPLGIATEFAQICRMLDGRHMASFSAGEDYFASGARIYEGNPTERLHELLSQHYAGTPTAKERLLTEGFIKHGYNMGDVVSDTPYGSWPGELGVDVENWNPGAFSKDGAQQVERKDLLHWLPFGIHVELDAARHYGVSTVSTGVLEKMEAFLQQGTEYEELFGEPYDAPRDGDSERDTRAISRAQQERERIQKFLEAHPRPNQESDK